MIGAVEKPEICACARTATAEDRLPDAPITVPPLSGAEMDVAPPSAELAGHLEEMLAADRPEREPLSEEERLP